MSQSPSQYVMVPYAERNTLGLVGFIISLVGLLLTGGILCPIGLILSLIALGRQPRGFAIAGTILGFLGMCGGILVFLVFGAIILAALGIGALGAFMVMAEPERMEVTVDMAQVAEAVEKEKANTGYLPAALSSLGLASETLVDPWGNNYDYTLMEDAPGYDIISHGKDGQLSTVDDIQLSKLDEYWQTYFDVTEDTSGGTVKIRMGDRTMTVHGDDQGGKVTVDVGDRTIQITGDDQGGRVTVTPTPPAVPEAPEEPAAPETPAPDSPTEPAPTEPAPE